MSERKNGRRQTVPNRKSCTAEQIRNRRLLAEYLRNSRWDEAMNRKREWWLFERKHRHDF